MKKIVLLAFLPLLMVACKKDLTSINVDPKNPQVAPAAGFFTNAQKGLVDQLASTNVNTNIFRLVLQYWQETTYTDESNFDLTTRQIPANMWNTLYRDVIRDLREAKKLIPVDVSNADVQKNQLAIAEITEIVTWYYLVTTYGNIPYTEALDINNLQPTYDDQKTVYYDLLTRLDAAISNLNTSAEGFGGADIIYGGDPAAWLLFANSFKLKMGMTIADFDTEKAKATVEAAVTAGVFTSNDENASFQYLSGPPNTNPVWVDLVQSGRKDFVAASTIINRLGTLNDPRKDEYFSTDANGGYTGGTPGASSPWAQYSKPNPAFFENPEFPAVLLSYSEVEFFLAEAKERGYNVTGTAAEHYANAVTASIEYWGGTTAEATTYLAQTSVKYNSANWKQLIGEQKWIALYNQGWDSWIEWRRLDQPQLVAPATAETDIPVRFYYPTPEQNLNGASYTAAAAAIGGDEVTTKLFWDKF